MKHFVQQWWSLSLRGLFLLIFGVIAVTAPNMPTETLVFYLGFFSLALALLFGFLAFTLFKKNNSWLMFGVMALVDGIITWYCLLHTSRAAVLFLMLIGIWALFMGAAIIFIGLKSSGTGRALILINGSLSVAFSLLVFFNPLKSTAVNFMVGFYTILLSLFLLYLSYRMLKRHRVLDQGEELAAMEEGQEPAANDDSSK